jgi:hypothetical protein
MNTGHTMGEYEMQPDPQGETHQNRNSSLVARWRAGGRGEREGTHTLGRVWGLGMFWFHPRTHDSVCSKTLTCAVKACMLLSVIIPEGEP